MGFQNKFRQSVIEMRRLARELQPQLKTNDYSFDEVKQEAHAKAVELSHYLREETTGHFGGFFHEERQDFRYQLTNIFHNELKRLSTVPLIPTFSIKKVKIVAIKKKLPKIIAQSKFGNKTWETQRNSFIRQLQNSAYLKTKFERKIALKQRWFIK